ncbi:NAD-dependent epimerase/dehydratase family protein [Gracilibacillus timonensis]|uniref:NAD-dependent epimerase/dehydratase family protein n=1 Tax=Gracilibacillus timonensis TaxID=1816696 RepID=UPI00082420B8|nr:NAD(P)-dependent oxidoreductase [Gracilibacillus timonensis]
MSQEVQKTVLVSGASGFLGKELVYQLVQFENNKVVAITSQKENLKQEFRTYSNLKILSTDDWADKLDKQDNIDILVNCAFPRSSDPTSLAKGLDFTEEIVKNSIKLNIKSIINISSQSVYSQKAKSLTDETAEIVPQSLYGMAKYAGEKIVCSLCENENISYSNIRLASLTGKDFEVRMTNRFVKQVLNGEKILVNGGKQKVSYLEVQDAASALIAMMNVQSMKWKPIYNLGSHYSNTVLEIVETVLENAKKRNIMESKVEVNPNEDSFNNLIDSSKFYTDFSWEPHYDINLMIEELFDHYKNK